ncbi:hypothetical protein [uncultured Winogradskyella sp.]|uniref:hypothetical protein n=1 Tax=uncultured Winogradskyella sp. TaxID=395353 RepID=UPI0026200908|nr:hypothetical protein [uncultured Winogradskyella sp.]
MNRLLFFVFFTSSIFIGSAQDKTKDEILQLIADDTCKCIATSDVKAKKTMKEKELALGVCLIKSYGVRKKESSYFKKNPQVDFEALGEEVGVLMVGTCGEDFMALFNEEELGEYIEDYADDSSQLSYTRGNVLSLDVTLVSMENNIVSSITMTDDFDKSHTFVIINEFDGANQLKKSNFGKQFYVEYQELDIYDLSEKRYVKKKVLKSINKQ